MEAVLTGITILLAGLVVWLVLQNSKGQRNDGAMESQVSELRHDLQAIANAQAQSSGQVQAIAQSVTQRLESVTTRAARWSDAFGTDCVGRDRPRLRLN